MAFAGMFLGTVFIIILSVIYFIAFVELIVAIIMLATKHKKPAIVLFILSAIPAVLTLIAVIIFGFTISFPKFDTPDGGTVTISESNIGRMKDYIRGDDMEGLDEFLDDHPELIYYQDTNHMTLLEYGLRNCDVEIMQIAVDHGAKFDDKAVHENLVYDNSLERFLSGLDYWVFAYSDATKPEPRFTEGDTTDEIIDAARFAVEHGANVEWDKNTGHFTFAGLVEEWIGSDGRITDKDRELLDLANSALN